MGFRIFFFTVTSEKTSLLDNGASGKVHNPYAKELSQINLYIRHQNISNTKKGVDIFKV